MKKILLTGSTGFIGRNVLPALRDKYDVVAPKRSDLNLLDHNEIKAFLEKGNFDVVLQCANPNPVKNPACDKIESMFEDSMRIFYNFYNNRSLYNKMIYIGSGAEYGKTGEIKLARESDVGKRIPKDTYGLAKIYMNELALKSENIYNLRIFGCYGPYDHSSKFLTHVINCCQNKEKITIRQNCFFDYIHVTDVAKAMIYMMENKLKYHDYNVCSGKRIELTEIAEKIKKFMCSDSEIEVQKKGYNNEYTGSNERFLNETNGKIKFMDIDTGIKLQIEHEEEMKR